MRIRVGNGNRAGGMFDGLQGGMLGRMAHIHNDAKAVHFRHDSASHAGEPRVFGFITARRQQGLVVIGQLHKTHAKPLPYGQKVYIVFNRRWVLEAEENRRAVSGAGEVYVLGVESLEDKALVAFKMAVP